MSEANTHAARRPRAVTVTPWGRDLAGDGEGRGGDTLDRIERLVAAEAAAHAAFTARIGDMIAELRRQLARGRP